LKRWKIIAVLCIVILIATSATGCISFGDEGDGTGTDEGFFSTKVRCRLSIVGGQWSTSHAPSDGSLSSTTNYKVGNYNVTLEPIGGVDDNNQDIEKPLLKRILSPNILEDGVIRSPGQLGNNQGFGNGSIFKGAKLMDTKDGLLSGSQILFDTTRDAEYKEQRSRGLVMPPVDGSRAYARVEEKVHALVAEKSIATPTLQFTITAKGAITGKTFFSRDIQIPVPIPLPFDPAKSSEEVNTTDVITVYVFTPFKVLGQHLISVAATGSYVQVETILGTPLTYSDIKDIVASKVPYGIAGLAQTAIALIITAIVKVVQFFRTISTGVAYDQTEDKVDLLNTEAQLLAKTTWIYGGEVETDRGADTGSTNIFSGSLSGSDSEW